jgi:phosphotransferase system HPr (HPr) family protein
MIASPISYAAKLAQEKNGRDDECVSRSLRVINPSGLHLRAAAEIVKVALKFDAPITLIHHGVSANARSILKVASLAVSAGESVVVMAKGPDSAEALEALAELFRTGFHESRQEDSGLTGFTEAGGIPAGSFLRFTASA